MLDGNPTPKTIAKICSNCINHTSLCWENAGLPRICDLFKQVGPAVSNENIKKKKPKIILLYDIKVALRRLRALYAAKYILV